MHAPYKRCPCDSKPVSDLSEDAEAGDRGATSTTNLLSSSIKEVEKFAYQTNLGHDGKVLCIDGSDGMDWILSGGEDCTARLWHWNEDDFQCYRLAMLLDHHGCQCGITLRIGEEKCGSCHEPRTTHPDPDHPDRHAVTSVAFAGNQGPAISVTRKGQLFITSISSGRISKYSVSPEEICDVRVKREEYKGEDTQLLALASGRTALLSEIDPNDAGEYKHHCIAKFEHNDKVMSAQHVPGDVQEGAALVTCAGKSILLWTLKNEVLQKLDIDENFSRFHIAQSQNKGWGWLAGGAGEDVYFWPLRNGHVYTDDQKQWPVKYPIGQKVVDVAIGPECDLFIVEREDAASEMRQIVPGASILRSTSFHESAGLLSRLSNVSRDHTVSEEHVIDAPADHGGQLVAPGKEITMQVLEHTVRCTETCVRNDDDDGRVLLVSFSDGSVGIWDMQGTNAGERMADMRSMSYIEVLTPVCMRLATFLQLSAFAFGEASRFKKQVKEPTSKARYVLLFNMHGIVPHLKPSDLFFPEVFLDLAMMCTFILLVILDVPAKLKNYRMWIMRTEGYAREAQNWCGCGCYRILSGLVHVVREIINAFIFSCASIFVVPMFKVCCKVIDCEHPVDGSQAFLTEYPDIICYKEAYWKLVGVFAVVVPVYFALLLSYAIVNGDPTFMPWVDLCGPYTAWERHAVRKATLSYQGPMHPQSESILPNRVVELCTKIAFPCIVMLTTDKPRLQMGAISFCALVVYVTFLRFPPLVDPIMCSVIQGSQMLLFCFMLCGFLTTAVPRASDISTYMLAVSIVLSAATTCCYAGLRKPVRNKARASVLDDMTQAPQLLMTDVMTQVPTVRSPTAH